MSMPFAPSSDIYLCHVQFDNSYKHQVTFENRSEQLTYFKSKAKLIFNNYLTVRRNAGGSNICSVKVNANIDEIQSAGINYLFYVNKNHNTSRYFYCFVTSLNYISEGTTEIFFETDVFQTWWFDVQIKSSFVVREHVINDKIGNNIAPESFSLQEYTYSKISFFNDDEFSDYCYIVGATTRLDEQTARGALFSGIYSGIFLYVADNVDDVNYLIETLETNGDDCISFITLIPNFAILESNPNYSSGTMLGGSDEPAKKYYKLEFSTIKDGYIECSSGLTTYTDQIFEGYKPKNNKMFTAPFFNLTVSNHAGKEMVYNIEDFDDIDMVCFYLTGDISASPTITLYPAWHKGLPENFDDGISITTFPQCSYNTDMYKLWMIKNQYAQDIQRDKIFYDTLFGAFGSIWSKDPVGVVSSFASMNVAQDQLHDQKYQASRQPNKANSGDTKPNLLTGLKMNKFDFYIRTLKYEHAKVIDEYFTMYGYQINQVKVPEMYTRKKWNYVQTVGVNLIGGIPNDDMEKLKAMFNSGVTFWRKDATIGDYTVSNEVKK